MENSFVAIAYDKNKSFISTIERGPFNFISEFFHVKIQKKKLKEYLSKEEIKVLQPFDLEKQGLEIEDVEGWEDAIFLKGKRNPTSFLNAFLKFKVALPLLITAKEMDFYEKPLNEFSTDLENLLNSNEVKYLTFYDLLV